MTMDWIRFELPVEEHIDFELRWTNALLKQPILPEGLILFKGNIPTNEDHYFIPPAGKFLFGTLSKYYSAVPCFQPDMSTVAPVASNFEESGRHYPPVD
jgi:hypothetical protein